MWVVLTVHVSREFIVLQQGQLDLEFESNMVRLGDFRLPFSKCTSWDVHDWHDFDHFLNFLKLSIRKNTQPFALIRSQATERVNWAIGYVVFFDYFLILLDQVWSELGDLHEWIITCPHALHKVLLELLHDFERFGRDALKPRLHRLLGRRFTRHLLQLLNHIIQQSYHLWRHLSNVLEALVKTRILTIVDS